MSTETEKIVIAVEYLDTAATLWLYEINYFSAMHLSAAAEEISGKACRMAKINSHYDDLRMKVIKSLKAVGIEHTEKQIKDAFYGAKNSVKHMDSINDALVDIEPRKESADYIISAYRNFEKLGLQDQLPETVKRVIDANALYIDVDASLKDKGGRSLWCTPADSTNRADA